ncbi:MULTISPECIES: hypothetical protein [unclassified Moorena]|nr:MULTISPECIES: hypothetical protein [unclassified Moorena]
MAAIKHHLYIAITYYLLPITYYLLPITHDLLTDTHLYQHA